MLIRPKEGILDPQGKAVERALPALGFDGVSHVRVGRMVELEAEDGADLEALCEKLLANPLIEDYEITTNVPPASRNKNVPPASSASPPGAAGSAEG